MGSDSRVPKRPDPVPICFEIWIGSDSRFQWVSRFGWVLIPGFRGARNRFQWVCRMGSDSRVPGCEEPVPMGF